MHAWRKLVTALLAAPLVVVAATASPARADATGDAWTDGKNVGAGASTTNNAPSGSTGRGSVTKPVCEWDRLGAEHAAIADRLAETGTGAAKGDGLGAWYRKICTDSGGSTATVIWVPDRIDPRVLAEQAADRVPIPDVEIEMNPTPEQGAVVNVPTWLAINGATWRSVNAQAAAGGVVVTATAAPRRVVWDMGNGDRITCAGPGTPYDVTRPSSDQSTDCSYTYRQSSARADGNAFAVTATVVWEVSWTVAGAGGGGSLGTAPRSQTVRLPVKEIQAVNR